MNIFSRIRLRLLNPRIQYKLRRNYCLSEKDVFKKQDHLLNNILSYAVRYCPFYHDYAKNNPHTSITDFPVISKNDISPHFDQFRSLKYNNNYYSDAYTGGSMGEPFHFLLSGGYEDEFGQKRWKTYGYKQGEVILAMDGTKIEKNLLDKNIYWKKKNPKDIPFGSWALSSLYLTDSNASIYCKYISTLHPSYLRGYPSFIYAIAVYSEKLCIDLTFIKAVELTSETVQQYQINKIKEVIACAVYLQYGHTESCICANTFDESYRYRVEPLYGYIEVLDNNNNHVKDGEIGEVVVTTLHNMATPLIRYRTGDLAEYGGRDDRYIYLNNVIGRTQDYIVDKDGNTVLLTALIFAQHFKALGNIVKWQIVQDNPGIINIRIIKTDSFSSEDEKEIYELFLTLGHVTSTIDYVEEIPLTPRGKSKMLIQNIKI